LQRDPLRQIQMVSHRQEGPQIGYTQRVGTQGVPETGINGGLIEQDPVLDAIAQAFRRLHGAIAKPSGHVAVGEPAPLLQRLGQVPMKERCKGCDARSEQFID
jgi:hypothetical protein